MTRQVIAYIHNLLVSLNIPYDYPVPQIEPFLRDIYVYKTSSGILCYK